MGPSGDHRSSVRSRGAARFFAASLAGSLSFGAVCSVAPPAAQLAALGSVVSTLAGLVLAVARRQEEREGVRDDLLARLGVPVALAREPELFLRHAALTDALAAIARSADPVLRDVAGLKLAAIVEDAQKLAAGRIEFRGTESWRAAYERVLDRRGIYSYRSSAWVRTAGYWQDAAGRRSMRLNYALARRGMRIQRAVILPEALWPVGLAAPVGPVRRWLEEQRQHGIELHLARERSLSGEPDLPSDFGTLRRPRDGDP